MRNVERTEIICELEKALQQYRKVLLFLPSCDKALARRLLESDIYATQHLSLKVYVPEGVIACVDVSVQVLSEQEIAEMLSVYQLYEFADNMQIIGESQNYGGLLNYVKTGVLTEPDFFAAVLS